MKKSKVLKITTALLAAILAVVSVFTLVPSVESAAASKVTEGSFVASGLNLTLGVDYDYSFAVVGDTQNLNYRDVAEGNKNMNKLYNWIKENQAEKNIKYVMGLGDVTQSFHPDQTWYDEEWPNAAEALKILDDANIPYSIVRGNHDRTGGFNGIFGIGTEYYNDLKALEAEGKAGFYDDEKVEETWRKVEVGTDKFLIFTLDWFPSEGSMAWMENIINANPDYRVIVTTHHFIAADSTFADDADGTFPYEQENSSNKEWQGVSTGGNVSPRQLWEDVLSQYANVELILCGHVDEDDIKVTQLRGVNGNTVTCMLIDAQSVDLKRVDDPKTSAVETEFEGNVGMVTMLYFKESGEIVNVEHISTVRAMDNKVEGATQKNVYLKANNQFSVKLEYADGWTKTDYGYIPTEKYNNENNYFHMFTDDDGIPTNDNIYLGSYERWVNDDATAGAYIAAKQYYDLGGITVRRNKSLYILMNKEVYDGHNDKSYNKASGFAGGFTLDLCGNTYVAGNNPFLYVYGATNDRRANINLVNGDIKLSGWNPFIGVQASSTRDGEADLNLKNLNVYFDDDGTGTKDTPIISTYGGTASASTTLNMTVTDCNFNLKDNAPNKTITAFSLNEANKNHHTKLVLNGGSISASSSSKFVLFAGNEGSDSITFGKGNSGNYTTLTLGDNATLPGIYNADDGTLVKFGAGVENEGAFVYSLEATEATGLNITTNNVFVGFDQNGVQKVNHPTWSGAFNKDNAANNYILYLTQDCDANQRLSPGAYTGAITIDLQGHTLTALEANKGLMNFFYSSTDSASFHVTFKNGTIKHEYSDLGLFILDYSESASVGTKAFDFTFENVTFEGYNKMFTFREKAAAYEGGVTTNAVFNNCTFNYSDQVIFDLGANATTAKKAVANVTVNGGKFITDTPLTQSMIYSGSTATDYADTFTFGKYDGKYPEIYLTSGNQTNGSFTLTNGLAANAIKLPGTVTLTEGGESYTVYQIGDAVTTVSTAYGIIPQAYANTESYPFAIFKDNVFVNATNDWATLLKTVGGNSKSDTDGTFNVLLRRDFSIADPSFSNLSFINGTVNIDLGGFELAVQKGNIFSANKKSANDTTLTISNGDILLYGSAKPLAIATSNAGAGYSFEISYTKVNFSYAEGATPTKFIDTFLSKDVTVTTSANITFTECNIDLATNITNSLTFLDLGNDANNHIANVLFDGGSIYANGSVVNFAAMNAENTAAVDTVRFSSESGRYTKIISPLYNEAISFDFVTVSGSIATTAKWNDNEILGVTTYIVRESALVGFAPKSSITLGSNLIYNIYVPVCDELASISVMGNVFDDLTLLDSYITTLEDGKKYYRIPVQLMAEFLANEVNLSVVLSVNGKSYSGSWNMSIPKYAKNVIANDSATDAEKTVIKDALAYIRSAYTFFDSNDKESVSANIDKLLAGHTQSPFAMDAIDSDTSALAGATFSLSSLHSVIFYLPEGANANDYTFKVGSRVLDFTYGVDNTDGEYKGYTFVKINLYAYEVLESIDCYAGGKMVGNYHISSYYSWAKNEYTGEDKDALVDLVEKFYVYCKSAEAYRASVVKAN